MEQVRRAVLADADQIAAVHRLSRATYYGPTPDDSDDRAAMWRQLLSGPDRLTYVVELSGRVVAFMSTRRDIGSATLELSAIYVHPERFGQGLGSRLYRVFEGERGPGERAVLEVWAANTRTIDVYKNRGWTPTSSTRDGPKGIPLVAYELVSSSVDGDAFF